MSLLKKLGILAATGVAALGLMGKANASYIDTSAYSTSHGPGITHRTTQKNLSGISDGKDIYDIIPPEKIAGETWVTSTIPGYELRTDSRPSKSILPVDLTFNFAGGTTPFTALFVTSASLSDFPDHIWFQEKVGINYVTAFGGNSLNSGTTPYTFIGTNNQIEGRFLYEDPNTSAAVPEIAGIGAGLALLALRNRRRK